MTDIVPVKMRRGSLQEARQRHTISDRHRARDNETRVLHTVLTALFCVCRVCILMMHLFTTCLHPTDFFVSGSKTSLLSAKLADSVTASQV